MAESTVTEARTSHLSIGEVLGLLLEEFPEITISKIRFLESQGLIDPERTPSGYRKFYDDDIELLRCILHEQRENFLPLRVIKDRLDSGEIDPTNEQTRPTGIKNVTVGAHPIGHESAPPPVVAPTSVEQSRREHPAGGARSPAGTPSATIPAPTQRLTEQDYCKATGLTAQQVGELESFGVIASDSSSTGVTYGPDAVDIGRSACQLLRAGVDARHLRGWRVAAEREAGLFEQLIQPLLRQRNPDANRQALDNLAHLESVGGELRSALVRAALRHHDEH